ncbi:ATP-binding cassette domain-containing protein [Latilactobacillus fuchuensis]|uniref:ATP-binding cassette domain-containing protein n=1 Tax=Latilactobacillus fuchuensis TaxID=164393 RepID=UPI0039B0A5B8
MIEFKQVTKAYDAGLALNDLTLTIPDNQVFVLVGPSGSGKTTTLKMINRLIEPTNGSILIDGQPIDQIDLQTLRLNTGYVLQNIALFPNLTIEDNITIQLEVLKWPKAKRQQRAYELLALVDLAPAQYAQRYPSELSGGEQQRIGIIRALANNPKVILMDEPFSALDPVIKTQLQDLVVQLQQQLHNTVIFVTHDMKEALRLGQTIAVMKDGQIQQVGTAETIFNQPENQFVREFFDIERAADAETVQALLNSGLGQLVEHQAAELQGADSIVKLAQKLMTQPTGVTVQSAQQTWLLTTTDLTAFVAKRGV